MSLARYVYGLIDKTLYYDTGIALENLFQIGAGRHAHWVTRTLFGTGSLGSVTLTSPGPSRARGRR